MSIVDHVGCDEDPLGDSRVVDVDSEVVEVTDTCETFRYARDGVVEHWGVVLADVVGVWGSGGVQVVGLREASWLKGMLARWPTMKS